MPSTLSDMKKSFGVPYSKYTKAVVPKDKRADRANPGPGNYIKNIIDGPKLTNSKCGTIGMPKNNFAMTGSNK